MNTNFVSFKRRIPIFKVKETQSYKMSPMKNLHVHFDFDTVGNKKPDEELTTRKDSNAVMINYSRDELLILGQSKESKEPPKMVDLISDADEKRKEKVRHILKNGKIWKSWAESKLYICLTVQCIRCMFH